MAGAKGEFSLFYRQSQNFLTCAARRELEIRLTPRRRFEYKEALLFTRENNSLQGGEMGAVGEIILVFRDMVNMLFTVYIYIIIARAILSWVNPDPYNPIVRFLHNATDPVLNRIRRVVPLQFSGIDFSPLILLFGIYLLQRVVMVLLTRLALGL